MSLKEAKDVSDLYQVRTLIIITSNTGSFLLGDRVQHILKNVAPKRAKNQVSFNAYKNAEITAGDDGHKYVYVCNTENRYIRWVNNIQLI